jgi:UTP:GlnB (protein PII) uridylyltransferase
MQAFAKAQEHRVPLAPSLSRTLKAQVPLLTDAAIRRSPEAAAVLFRILSQPHAAPVLREMHRHGLLGAYIPNLMH